MSDRNIPSEHELDRARGLMRRWDRGLNAVSDKILSQFREIGVHEVFVFYSPGNDIFVAYIFYERDNQIEELQKTGVSAEIQKAIYCALEDVGRGDRATLNVQCEFDSHENVMTNFEGDYFLRLR